MTDDAIAALVADPPLDEKVAQLGTVRFGDLLDGGSFSRNLADRRVRATLKHFGGHGTPEGGRNRAPANGRVRDRWRDDPDRRAGLLCRRDRLLIILVSRSRENHSQWGGCSDTRSRQVS